MKIDVITDKKITMLKFKKRIGRIITETDKLPKGSLVKILDLNEGYYLIIDKFDRVGVVEQAAIKEEKIAR
jgi:hypothetical protein